MQANKCERKRNHPVTPCHPSEGWEFKKMQDADRMSAYQIDANCVCKSREGNTGFADILVRYNVSEKMQDADRMSAYQINAEE